MYKNKKVLSIYQVFVCDNEWLFLENKALLLKHFTTFSEYFISVSTLYLLIVAVLVAYSVYGLFLQNSISESLAVVLLMSNFLIFNDDLITLSFLTFSNSIINGYFPLITKTIVCFSSAIYFLIITNSLKDQRLTSFEYLLITLFAVLGLMLLCSSNDFLIAYLAIELTSLACYVLASFKKTSSYSVESGLKYFIMGAVSSAFFLLGSSLIYGLTGSINFTVFYELFSFVDPLSARIDFSERERFPRHMAAKYFFKPTTTDYSFAEIGLTLILFSLFIKLAVAPFHAWSLDVYEGSPTSAAFFFAIISKLSIFVLLVRLFYINFYDLKGFWTFYSLWLGVLSIFVGAFGGLKQRKLKTLLAYSSTSHMGYILITFGAALPMSIQIVFLYLIVYIITGLATWFIILLLRLKKKNFLKKYSKELGDFISLNKANSAMAFAFALIMFSIAGIPPMLGFLPKMGVFLILVNRYLYFVALLSVLFSVVATFYYVRVIKVLYFESTIVGKLYYPLYKNKLAILSLLVFLLIFLFVQPNSLQLFTYCLVLDFPSVTHELSDSLEKIKRLRLEPIFMEWRVSGMLDKFMHFLANDYVVPHEDLEYQYILWSQHFTNLTSLQSSSGLFYSTVVSRTCPLITANIMEHVYSLYLADEYERFYQFCSNPAHTGITPQELEQSYTRFMSVMSRNEFFRKTVIKMMLKYAEPRAGKPTGESLLDECKEHMKGDYFFTTGKHMKSSDSDIIHDYCEFFALKLDKIIFF